MLLVSASLPRRDVSGVYMGAGDTGPSEEAGTSAAAILSAATLLTMSMLAGAAAAVAVSENLSVSIAGVEI